MSKLIRLAAVAGLTGTLGGLFGVIPAASAPVATPPVATVSVATAAPSTETAVPSLLADDCWGW